MDVLLSKTDALGLFQRFHDQPQYARTFFIAATKGIPHMEWVWEKPTGHHFSGTSDNVLFVDGYSLRETADAQSFSWRTNDSGVWRNAAIPENLHESIGNAVRTAQTKLARASRPPLAKPEKKGWFNGLFGG